MKKIKIDKKVPVPHNPGNEGNKGNKGSGKYPWYEMEAGDSFFVAYVKLASMRSMASRKGKEMKVKFAVREERNGVRVWRTK
ncbi:MAG TPA: hypothetical protein ENH40_06510 [Nitrospirae bacterium]|nr:hypothetical protein [Nitrospirota bacterium]